MRKSLRFLTVLALAGSTASQVMAQAAAPPAPPAPISPQSSAVGASQAPSGPHMQAGPQVALGHGLVDAAGAFDGYVRRASAIKVDFHDGVTVARALDVGGVYDPAQLQQGAIAYAALVALQDRNFVEAVQEVGRDPLRREAFAARLLAQPRTVLDAGAARKAAARVAMVLGQMGVQVAQAGAAVNQAAYDVQAQDWSRAPIVGAHENLARLKARSVAVTLAPNETEQLIGGLAVYRSADSNGGAEAAQSSAVVTDGMALAALAILGKAGDDNAPTLATLVTDADVAHCLQRARLNLFECLAVVGPHYENLACLGRHGMTETGRCIAASAGMVDIALAAPVDRRSVAIPIAAEEPQTLERDGVMGAAPSSTSGVAVPLAASATLEQRPAAR